MILQTFTETRERLFEWASLPPPWVVFLVVIPLVVLFVAFFYSRENPTGGSRARWICASLRVAALLALLAILARPLLRETIYQIRDPQVLVLVDDSLSMRIQDKHADRSVPGKIGELVLTSPEAVDRTSRYDLVARLLRARDGEFIRGLRARGKVSLWSFAGRPRKLAELPRLGTDATPAPDPGEDLFLPEFEKVQGEERVKQTRIGDSLADAVWGGRGPLGSREGEAGTCVILFSDGQENGGTLQAEDVARKLGQRGIPLYTVGVGNPEPARDVRVAAFDASDVVLVGDKVSFDATVIADGFEGDRVRVDLFLNDQGVDMQYVTLEGKGARQSVLLSHAPKTPGDFTVTVKVEPLQGELFEENNVASRPLKVLDQKIRVLYLEGPPRWEYRYLMHALIRDPTMEAQVLLYSADKGFIQESSPGVQPLTAFPDGRENLFKYHVVILGDVDPDTDKLTAPQMELLNDFVGEAGGGLVFISGRNASPSRYLHTPLEQLLPVEVGASGREGLDSGRTPSVIFNTKLTAVGREHPVMRLDNDPEKSQRLWENPDGLESSSLPGFLWFAEVNREKKGAVKLAVHPTLGHPIYGPWVLFAFQNFGKGRTFFSAVDTTWRWRAGVDTLYFYRFWGQVVRFAASGRLMGRTPRFSITTDKLAYTIGDTVTISCQIYDSNMKPATDETVKVFHQVESAGASRLRTPAVINLPLNKVKGPGSYEGTIPAEELGRHDLWLGSDLERMATRSITVEVPALEFRDIRMNRDLLKRMAELSGGTYRDFADSQNLVDELGGIVRPRQMPIEDRLDDLWDNFWVLLLITAVLTGEWIYRKMVKLL